MGLAALDGALAFNSAHLPSSFISGDWAVAKSTVVVENTSVMVVAKGQNVHQTDTTSGFLADSTVNLGQSVVENVSNFTCRACEAEHVTNDERLIGMHNSRE